jgi:glycosidase
MKRLKIISSLIIATFLFTACNCCDKKEGKWQTSDVIYEVNVRQCTPEGTFNALVNELPRLKELGVDILSLMPIHPIEMKECETSLDSYCTVKDYTAVNPELGTPEDFKNFVKKAHEQGMYVIIGWLDNHTGYDNIDMCQEMTKALKFWLKEADIDGYCCSVASEVSVDFWEKAIAEIKTVKQNVLMLAKAETPSLMTNAFDMYYACGFYLAMNQVAQGKDSVPALHKKFAEINEGFPEKAIPVYFTSNHKENSRNGTEFERMGETGAEAFAALTYVMPGMPLIYNGQEAGLCFEKASIDRNGENAPKWEAFYKKMNALRKAHPALYSQPDGGNFSEIMTSDPDNIYAFMRVAPKDTVICFFNLSEKEIPCAFMCPREGTDKRLPLKAWEYSITTYGDYNEKK